MAVAAPSKLETVPTVLPLERTERYRVSVSEYIAFRRNGFLVVPGLVSPEEITELREHTEDLMQGRLPPPSRQMSARAPSEARGVAEELLIERLRNES